MIHAFLALKPGIAGKRQAGGCVCEHLALDSLLESIEAEIINSAIGHRLRKKRFPSNSEVNGKSSRRLPSVLRVRSQEILASEKRIGAALSQRADVAEEKIRHSVAGCSAIETERPLGIDAADRRRSVLVLSPAEGKLMRSPHQAQIVTELISRR